MHQLILRVGMLLNKHLHWKPTERLTYQPLATQMAVLQRLLQQNQYTQFGIKHGFSNISTYADFQKNIPVQTYDALCPYIEEQRLTGVKALTAESPQFYAQTSGTTSTPKYIPITATTLKSHNNEQALFSYLQYRACPQAFAGKALGIMGAAVEGELDSGHAVGSVSGHLYQSMPKIIQSRFVLPPEVSSIADYDIKYLVILRLALAEPNITYAGSPNPSTFLRLLTMLNLQREVLIQSLITGKLDAIECLDMDFKTELKRKLKPDPARAAALSRLPELTFANVWPGLKLITTWTGGSCGIALAALREKLPVNTKVMELGYQSTEFRGSIALQAETSAGIPPLHHHFFEFVEQSLWDNNTPEFLTLNQLALHQTYYVIVTTASGLYRYFMNDLVQIGGFFNATPLLSFVQKGKGVTNLTGEKLYESQVIQAVKEASIKLGLMTSFYILTADEISMSYQLFIQADALGVNHSTFANKLDEKLGALNIEYKAKRDSGRLAALKVIWLKSNVADAYKIHCINLGQREGQFKPAVLQYMKNLNFPLADYALGSIMTSLPTFKLVLNQLIIPFKVKFRHASAERAETSSIWVEAISTSGIIGYGESCPRSYVTGETMASVQHFFLQYQDAICKEISNLNTLREWAATHQHALDANPAAWCAIELAILDLLAKQENKTIEQLLNLPALHGCFQYTAVLGDANIEAFQQSAQQYIQQGFRDFKLKLSGELERDKHKIAVMRQWENIRLRVDANNLWQNAADAIHFLQALDYPFFAIEEPLKPNAYSELTIIASQLKCKIVLDESFLRIEQFNALQATPQYWLINLRISKMGGLLRSLAIIESARKFSIGLIVGAQVGETSLLTRCGLSAAQAASDILVAQEGAFGTHLLENDISESPLMFGKAGLLDVANHPCLTQLGFGFSFQKKPAFISALF